jgi:excisionase family DNA binding protein
VDDPYEVLIEAVAQRVLELMASQMVPNTDRPDYLSVGEAADMLRAKPQRIYDLVSAGRLTRHKDGRRLLVRRDELEEWLARSA